MPRSWLRQPARGALRRRLRRKQERVAGEEKEQESEEHAMHEWDAVAGLRYAAMLVAKVLAARTQPRASPRTPTTNAAVVRF